MAIEVFKGSKQQAMDKYPNKVVYEANGKVFICDTMADYEEVRRKGSSAFANGAQRARQDIDQRCMNAGVQVKGPRITVQWRDKQGEMQDKSFTDEAEANTFAKHNLAQSGATQIKVLK
jgi:hypothetical protein